MWWWGIKSFAEYGDFPKKSDFKHPNYVPHDVRWARFRMDGAFRLVGFLVPKELHNKCKKDKENEEYLFDRNTFYVVFLDKDHRFYKAEDK